MTDTQDHRLTYHERGGLGGLLFGLGMMTTVEGVAVHFALEPAHPRVAWALAAVNVYALIWLAAAFQAARLRPVLLSPDRLLVRTSLLWSVSVPRATIASVTRIDAMPRKKGVLRAAFGAPPNLLLSLTEPVVAHGLLGIRRTVKRIALYLDEPETLRAAITPRRPTPRRA